jgi:hypothetical protein
MKKIIYTLFVILGFANFTMAQVPSYVPTSRLAAYWSFSGNASDSSGNGNHGTVNGTVNLTTDRFNNPNSAYSFPGNSSSFINCGSSSSLRIDSAITISAWIFMDGGSLNPRIISFEGSYCTLYSMAVAGTSNVSRTLDALIVNSNGLGAGFCCGTSGNGIVVPSLSWQHIVFTAEPNSTAKLYRNGVLVGTSINTAIVNTLSYCNSLNIGRKSQGAFDAWGGKIDDIGIWNRALTATEISALYNGPSYTINAIAGSNGSISPSGITTVNSNASQRILFTPNTGYKVDSVIVDGIKVDSLVGYTFNNVTNNRTIRVTFTLNTSNINISCFTPAVKKNGNINSNWTYTASDRSGSIYHAGAYSGNITVGNTTLSGIGSRDFFLVKYDSCGNQQWAIRGGSTVDGDEVRGLVCDSLGNIYLVGRYNQTCTIYGIGGTSFVAAFTSGGSNSNHQDGFLVKLSPSGTVLWGATIQGGSNDGMNGVTVDPSGNPIVSAGFNGCCPSTFVATVNGTTNSLNISSFGSHYGTGAVIKFNSSGAVQWAARVYNRDALCGALMSDANGNIYVTGGFNSWTNSTAASVYDGLNNPHSLYNPGSGLGYLLKLSPSGAYIWGTSFGNTGDGVNSLTYGTGLDFDVNGNVWVAGYYSGAAPTFYSVTGSNLSGPSSTANRGFVVKYSAAGQALLLNTLQQTTSNNTQFQSIACNGSKVRAVGNYSGSNLGLSDIVIANYNLSAVQQNVQTTGGSGEDWANDIRKYKTGYLIAGSVQNGSTINGVNFNSNASFLWNSIDSVITPTYTINASAGSNGSISPSGTITVNSNTIRRFIFNANPGYMIDSVIVDGIKVDSIVGYTFNNVTSNRNIRVTFKCNPSQSTINLTIPSTSLPYTWNGLTFNAAGSQTKILTNAVGCDSAATLNLTVSFNPFQDTIKVCGTSHTLNAGSGYVSYNWNTSASSQSINVSSTGWYKCTVSNGTSTGADSVFVSMLNAQILNNDTTICSGATIQIIAANNCNGSIAGSPNWQLLIPSSSYTSSEINFNPNGFKQATQTWYSVKKNGSVNRVYAFNLANNTVSSLSSINAPGELYAYSFDKTNNRIVASRAGRDIVYSLPITGGSWQQIGTGSFDSESYGCNAFWNPISNRFSFFGGYGWYSTKNWVWENNGSSWINTYVNNNNCNLAKRVGNGIAPNSSGTKQYIFSGEGSCNGNQFASSCSLGSPWPTDVGVYCWLKDIWELDLTTYQFTNILPVNNQSITREGSFSFDYSKNAFYLIGGRAPTSTYAVYTPYSMDVSRFRRGIDTGFSNIAVGGIAPAADRDGISVYDSIGNRIIYARTDGVWALNLGGGCNLSYLWSNGATTPTISVTPSQTTTYYCTVSNGISSCIDSVTVTVNAIPPASTTNLTIPSSSLPYIWNGLTFNASGSQTKTLTNARGCDSSATLNLTVLYKTTQTPYLTTNRSDVSLTSILTVGDSVGSYKMVGIPDGLGAFDNNNGTFTLLMNHEINNSLGVVRAHGNKGAFVSKWVINKSDLSVLSGSDLITTVKLWNPTTKVFNTYNSASPMPAGISRLCSADLPPVSAFLNGTTGTSERIFLSGEESGVEGRAFAHILTGANAGTSYELPYLGKFSWENAVASLAKGNKTIVAGLDDVTGGQVYFYIGTKTKVGTEIDKAGLNNGKVFGVKVTGLAAEVAASIPAANTPFTMVDLGIVRDSTGASLDSRSAANAVTAFLRPEDGAWNPRKTNDFYFLTTASFNEPSRLWRLSFKSIAKPEDGGTITAVLDGTEGAKMMDNMAIDSFGNIFIQEDVGNQAHLGKTWVYNIENDRLIQIASHDTARFLNGGSKFLTQDEEASGIIDMKNILGKGKFLFVDQAHYPTNTELVEGGQLLAMTISDLSVGNVAIVQDSIEIGIIDSNSLVNVTATAVPNADDYKWTVPAGVVIVSGQGTTNLVVRFANPAKFSSPVAKPKAITCQARILLTGISSAVDSVRITKSKPLFTIDAIMGNPNKSLTKGDWTSTTTAGSTGNMVNVVSTAGLKAGYLVKLTAGTGNIGLNNVVDSVISATQFRLRYTMTINVSASATLKSFIVPQNAFAMYTSATGATNSSTTVTVSSTTGLAEGMLVNLASGTGTLKAGTVVSKVIDATTFVISLAPTVDLSNNAVLVGIPVLTNICPIAVSNGLSSEVDYSVIATPVNNIGYKFTVSKGARISRIGDSTIVGYDTATTTALLTVNTRANSIGVVFDSSFVSGIVSAQPYNNAGTALAFRVSVRNTKAAIYKVTSTAPAIKRTIVRYTASVTNGSEVTGYKWTLPANSTALSGSITGQVVITTTDTLSIRFDSTSKTAVFKAGSLKIEPINNCGTGTAKTFVLNGTTTLSKFQQEFDLEEVIENNELTTATKVNVYPNPNQGNFTVSITSNEKEAPAQVTIINMMGQEVANFTVENNNGTIETNINQGLADGLYFVKVKIGTELNIVKIVVTK